MSQHRESIAGDATPIDDKSPSALANDFKNNFPNMFEKFSKTVDFNDLPNYAGLPIPSYITKDNGQLNPITNSEAFLGRVLFYDVNLSTNNSTSCSSCHRQDKAFSDVNIVSLGANGFTPRHSMRLINSRFGDEIRFSWSKNAATLEDLTTLPIQDHNEMGFSGQNGAPNLDDLVEKLSSIPYYNDLFVFAFGDSNITQTRIQLALAQFVRSFQSFDSRYDEGRMQVDSDDEDFPNFTADENAGKRLFMSSRTVGGANCAICHRPPEFDIDPNSRNNGVISVFGSTDQDLSVTRSPTLRDLVPPDGSSNGSFMHDGSLLTLEGVVEHYDNGIVDNDNLDFRLRQFGVPQQLGLTPTEKSQLVMFLKTLSGKEVYNHSRWSSPFE